VNVLNPKRVLIAIAASAALCWTGWYCLRVGYARTLARVAVRTGNGEFADQAATLLPVDAETQTTRGELLQESGNYSEATNALNLAVSLRPRDYYLWVELGLARDRIGDQEGALRALRQAVVLAPSYANARWQLGNLLLRMGRLEESFAELRRAGSSNTALLPNIADLAWGVYRPDAGAIATALRPRSAAEHMALAIVFATHGEDRAAVAQFLLSDEETKEESQKLLGLLLRARAFREAYQVWAKMHGVSQSVSDEVQAVVRDGGFEEPLLLGDNPFAWQITPGLTNVVLSVDENNHQSGAKSLRIDFRGNSDPQKSLLTQTVLVRPLSHYELTFAARTQQLVSAALPIVAISDASDPARPILSQSQELGSDSQDWREVKIEFTAGAKTNAVIIAIRRQACSDNPCPAFGAVWWDSFALRPADAGGPLPTPKKIDALGRS
jgi:Flp pilus assembly protein TadD